MSESAPRTHTPELDFQDHVRDYLVGKHGYARMDAGAITHIDLALAGGELSAYLEATRSEALDSLEHDYGSDTLDEIVKALRVELPRRPFWMILRHGLAVRGREIRLFSPRPRSKEALASSGFDKNRWAVFPHFHYGERSEEVDLVVYLNGLPVVAMELKHEAAGQSWADAVNQFNRRDHAQAIFRLPFLFIASDTTNVQMATDPRRAANFRWLNADAPNRADTPGEYPVEHVYRDVLSPEQLAEALSFFLVRVPKRDAGGGITERSAYSLFPRYHQSRMVRRISDDALAHFCGSGNIGKKFLIDHSAGSGKTLSICWLADRLHSLYDTNTGTKLTDTVFILTDRKSLDKNIRDEIVNFSHLRDVVGIARRAEDLEYYLRTSKPIIVTTQQKFAWILEVLEKNDSLKTRRVAFLIDEAHRSQDGKLGLAVRKPFRAGEEVEGDDLDETDPELGIAETIRLHDRNQLFVAFTATPAPATVALFGTSFDSYTEAQAIAEGYIVDVARNIISYKTLYNLQYKTGPRRDDGVTFPKGLVARALQNIAFQDEELIQYKAEEMVRIFEESVKHLIGGRSKAMIVASSRIAGLRYFNVIKEKLKERKAGYGVLFAFSDFEYCPSADETGKEDAVVYTEAGINKLPSGVVIEDYFEQDFFRLLIVANKFQTGFSQPLLAGMFLDKTVSGRNAVQTVSRLNRCHPGKDTVVVVDFTNNATGIMKAFQLYRNGNPFEPKEPDAAECVRLYEGLIERGAFTGEDIAAFMPVREPIGNPRAQDFVSLFKARFESRFPEIATRKEIANLMGAFVDRWLFLSCFFTFEPCVSDAASFAEYVGPQLIRIGGESDFMKRLKDVYVTRSSVAYIGEVSMGGKQLGTGGRSGGPKGNQPPRISLQDMIDEIRAKYEISDEEALYIKEVTEEKTRDDTVRLEVLRHRNNRLFLDDRYRPELNGHMQQAYDDRGRIFELADPRYTDAGGIFDIMAVTVIDTLLMDEAG